MSHTVVFTSSQSQFHEILGRELHVIQSHQTCTGRTTAQYCEGELAIRTFYQHVLFKFTG